MKLEIEIQNNLLSGSYITATGLTYSSDTMWKDVLQLKKNILKKSRKENVLLLNLG